MAVRWTEEQQQVIDARNKNILVSAAAGSGKTAVLVERIIQMISDETKPVDIDRLLIVTFTNAAAAEMRERIAAAIERKLDETASEHLLKQTTLLHNAQITTIDSFCLYVIRNHFHEIDLEPNFRIGDEGELKLLRQDVLERVLERNYEAADEVFVSFADSYSTGRSDAGLCDMILKLYEFCRSYPWPKAWLASCAKGYEITEESGFFDAPWIGSLTERIRLAALDMEQMMLRALALAQADDGPSMYEKLFEEEIKQYQRAAQCTTFEELRAAFAAFTFARLPTSRGFAGDAQKLAQAKAWRDQAKDVVKKINTQYFYCSTEQMIHLLRQTAPAAAELVRLTNEFYDAFAAEKRRKNIVDFSDLEHFALEILVDKETGGVRAAAEEFCDTFEEIMIDEYQDSNYVQETILRAVSRESRGLHNIFMVGDVKQSIYRFRLARPELFMEKYDSYPLAEEEEDSGCLRIDLFKNFRSRPQVLSFANDIFFQIMKKDIGNVCYDERAALYAGADYRDTAEDGQAAGDMFLPELLLVDDSEELLADGKITDKRYLEAKLISARIQRLLTSQLVTDQATGALRPVRCSDIVILLRSLGGTADTFAEVLNGDGIPAHTVSQTGYFSAVEVQTVLALLRVLDNPRQDIPLAAVLRSPIVGLCEEELGRLRLFLPKEPFHVCVLEKCKELRRAYREAAEREDGAGTQPGVQWEAYEDKLYQFYMSLVRWRGMVPDTPIHLLIELLLKETGYGNYAAAMPGGERRRANLLMLVERAISYEATSYKGLFHFVRYIDQLRRYEVDFGEADMVGENENVVRIMSIHKSKGLEFPVVFVSCLGKQFNKQDVRSRMVLHPELGIGLDCIDGKRRLLTPTIIKKAIAKQIDLENLGEELRILYVALTRAKEKLILTGNKKGAAEELAASDFRPELSYLERESAAGYLDWLLPVLKMEGGKYPVRFVSAAELVTEEVAKQVEAACSKEECQNMILSASGEGQAWFDERFAFVYPYASEIGRPNKYSVSELKHRAMREKLIQEEDDVLPLFLKEEIVPYVPAFARTMEEEQSFRNQGALRGTAMHRVMECYHFAGEQPAAEQIETQVMHGLLTEEMRALVKVSAVEKIVQSELGARMKSAERAGLLYREKPFVMGFTKDELEAFGFAAAGETKGASSDLTLIQGIIDVFWQEEDGIVVLDYKTDRVESAAQLIDRYEAQLRLYGEALERIFAGEGGVKLPVKERLLYSFRLGEVIPIV